MKAQSKILYLPIQKKWFDLIRLGVKNEEYRALTAHYTSRLISLHGKGAPCFKTFDFVHFTNGYGNHRPQVRCVFKSVSIQEHGVPSWGFTAKCYVIKLGAVVSVQNVPIADNTPVLEFY